MILYKSLLALMYLERLYNNDTRNLHPFHQMLEIYVIDGAESDSENSFFMCLV